MSQIPNIETHIPVTHELPVEENNLLVGRPDLPTPSLWQPKVMVTHKAKVDDKGRKLTAVVRRVDYSTNMFRAFYPDPDGGVGRESERTEWEHCRDWDVETTFSPAELERQAARRKLDEEISKLDKDALAAVMVLVDDTDATKALAKLNALRVMGVIKASPEATKALAEDVKPAAKK